MQGTVTFRIYKLTKTPLIFTQSTFNFRKRCVEMGYKEYTTCAVNMLHDMDTEHMPTYVNLSWLHDLVRYQGTAKSYTDKINF